jgi:hypothetical protein
MAKVERMKNKYTTTFTTKTAKGKPIRHLVIPDTQCKDGVNLDHLTWVGNYIVDQKPDVIIHIGDHYDLPSLSSYDTGTLAFEGRRYKKDIEAGNRGMDLLMAPIIAEQARQRKNKDKVWKPRMIFTIGNHEQRIIRAVNDDPKLEGLMSFEDFNLKQYGWEVLPFLEVAVVDEVCYSHYFCSGIMGRPTSSAKALLTKKHMSCVQGHVQDRDIAYDMKGDGSRITGLFVGICYQHDEGYLTPQTNGSWRGLWVLNDVENGAFDELPVSLTYLEREHG